MSDLYLLNEVLTNSLNYGFLDALSALSILSGILVIISKNPIVSVLFLIGLFIAIASYLMMLGINFIGLAYLLVYVGAVSILFLFILMLINVRISELVGDSSNSIPLAIMIGIFFNLALTRIFPSNFNLETSMNQASYEQVHYIRDNIYHILNNLYGLYHNELFFVTSPLWDGKLSETFHITSIGNIIYTNFPLWLILTSIILLLAMIGSILITIKPPKPHGFSTLPLENKVFNVRARWYSIALSWGSTELKHSIVILTNKVWSVLTCILFFTVLLICAGLTIKSVDLNIVTADNIATISLKIFYLAISVIALVAKIIDLATSLDSFICLYTVMFVLWLFMVYVLSVWLGFLSAVIVSAYPYLLVQYGLHSYEANIGVWISLILVFLSLVTLDRMCRHEKDHNSLSKAVMILLCSPKEVLFIMGLTAVSVKFIRYELVDCLSLYGGSMAFCSFVALSLVVPVRFLTNIFYKITYNYISTSPYVLNNTITLMLDPSNYRLPSVSPVIVAMSCCGTPLLCLFWYIWDTSIISINKADVFSQRSISYLYIAHAPYEEVVHPPSNMPLYYNYKLELSDVRNGNDLLNSVQIIWDNLVMQKDHVYNATCRISSPIGFKNELDLKNAIVDMKKHLLQLVQLDKEYHSCIGKALDEHPLVFNNRSWPDSGIQDIVMEAKHVLYLDSGIPQTLVEGKGVPYLKGFVDVHCQRVGPGTSMLGYTSPHGYGPDGSSGEFRYEYLPPKLAKIPFRLFLTNMEFQIARNFWYWELNGSLKNCTVIGLKINEEILKRSGISVAEGITSDANLMKWAIRLELWTNYRASAINNLQCSTDYKDIPAAVSGYDSGPVLAMVQETLAHKPKSFWVKENYDVS